LKTTVHFAKIVRLPRPAENATLALLGVQIPAENRATIPKIGGSAAISRSRALFGHY
jgi:hypothetical protein